MRRIGWSVPPGGRPLTLDIRILGMPHFAQDGKALALRAPARALALLAYLAVNPGAVLRKRAAFVLWPDADEESALANLRRHLALLEGALPPPPDGRPWIRKGRTTIEWSSDDRSFVDAIRYEELSADPQQHREAVTLYGGEFLEGVSDDEWVIAHRERLSAQQMSMLGSLAQRLHASGDPMAALEYAEQAYRLDPWREDVLREILLLRRDLGDVAGALAEFQAFRTRLKAELDAEPADETLAAVEALSAPREDVAVARAETPRERATSAPPNNLANEPGALIGRAETVDNVRALLEDAALVTLVGPGGVGKTRIARRLAASLLSEYPDGAWFVDLAPIADGTRVSHAVAAALGLIEVKDRPIAETLEGYLRTRRLLIVLDNCEHVIDEAARIAAALLRSCPQVRMIATSREPLNVEGESVFAVPPLEVADAVGLLVARIQSVDARFRLTDESAPMVTQLCRQLDGLPLALELAAPRVKALGLRSVVDLLARRFAVLTGGKREVQPRQRTLQSLYDWSYDLLPERERIVFRRLGTFSGGWSLEAACSVCSDERLGDGDILDIVTALVTKSLVQSHEPPDGLQRFSFLESTRQYALLKLDASGETKAIAHNHLDYFAGLAARFDASWLSLPDAECFAIITPDLDNIRSALNWGIAEGNDPVLGATLAVHCERLWTISSYLEGRRWLKLCLDRVDAAEYPQLAARVLGVLFQVLPDGPQRLEVGQRASDALRATSDEVALARVLATYGLLVGQLGRVDEGIAALEEALSLAERNGDPRDAANAAAILAVQKQLKGDFEAALALNARAVALHEAVGSISGRAYALFALAELEFSLGEAARAIASAAQAQELLHTIKAEVRVLGMLTSNMAAYAIAEDDFGAAATHAREAVVLLRDLEDLVLLPLQHLAVVEVLNGNAQHGARLLGFTDAQMKRLGMERGVTERSGFDRALATLRERFGESDAVRFMARGADLPLAAVLSTVAPVATKASLRETEAAKAG